MDRACYRSLSDVRRQSIGGLAQLDASSAAALSALPGMVGVGLDLQSADEVRPVLWADESVFTRAECDYIRARRAPAESAAGVFAAKEALLKAMPHPVVGSWTDIEVGRRADRAPYFLLRGPWADHFEEHRSHSHLSISHSGGIAGAIVLVFEVRDE